MAENGFPKPIETVVATLVDIYRHQKQFAIVEILETASPHFVLTDYDNWNGGASTFALLLEIPVPLFASVESELQSIEEGIRSKLTVICRDLSNDHIGSVTITPIPSDSANIGRRPKPADFEVSHIWKAGFFRLFLSHVSAHKLEVANLKSELDKWGISAFVAHEDISPSLEWQQEIDLALRTMDALAALLTREFHASDWTDQEVGFALGKGVLVVPIRLGADPYGFIGKVQGLSGSFEQPALVAERVLTTLLDNDLTHRRMRMSLVSAFEGAKNYSIAKSLSKVISTVKNFSENEKAAIQHACKTNSQIVDAFGVVSRVCSALGVPEPNESNDGDDVPF